jgi:hypothetical protein
MQFAPALLYLKGIRPWFFSLAAVCKMDVEAEKSAAKAVPVAAQTVTIPLEQFEEMARLIQDARSIVMETARPDSPLRMNIEGALQALTKDAMAGTLKQRMLCALDSRVPMLPPRVGPAALEYFKGTIRNSTDLAYEKEYRGKGDEAKRERRERKWLLQLTKMVSHVIRCRNEAATPKLIIQNSIERCYQGTTLSDWRRQSEDRSLMSNTWVDNALATVKGWKKEADEGYPPLQSDYALVVKDNLEWWMVVKWQRIVNGEKKETELIHTVTGESIPVPASMVMEEIPVMETWPYQDQYDMHRTVPTDDVMHDYLGRFWNAAASRHQDGDVMCLLRRPPPMADFSPGRKPTLHHTTPVLMHCGTASYDDAIKIVASARRNNPKAKKIIIVGDMQTFIRLFYLKMDDTRRYNDIVPWAGEWHQGAHYLAGVVLLNWKYIIEPIVHHLGIKGVNERCIMKEHTTRYRWVILILTAGMTWLKSIYSPEEVASPKTILHKVRKNTPVCDFIGFLYYMATGVLAHKTALQLNDPDTLNYMWRHSIMVYAPTGKFNYKKGVLQNSKTLFDSEPNVANIVELMRTYTQSGQPCTGAAYDYMNEQVCLPAFFR